MSKKKSKNARLRRKKEFRFHKIEMMNRKKKIWHPTYIFLQKGSVYIYVSITHSKKVKNRKTVQLRKNPNPLDKRDSFYVDEILEDKRDTFSKIENNWSMDDKDDQDLRDKYEKNR